MPYPYKSKREWIEEEERLGNVLRIKPPIKCGDYRHIVDLGNGVPGKGPETELRAVARYLHSLPGKPVGILENPVDNRPDIPVIINLWPTRERTLRAVGARDINHLADRLGAMKANRLRSVAVPRAQAPCKEVIVTGKDLDLRKDIPRVWVEFNQMLWSTCNGTVVVYDPKSKTHDLGKLRTGQYEWKDANPATPAPEDRVKTGMYATFHYLGSWASNAGRFFNANYRSKNQPMPCALIFGVPTDIHMVAASKEGLRWPETGDEYEIVAGLRGEPVELVESETVPGLMVPATAEWVIEGEFLPEDEVMPPYAEDIASGYMFGGERCPVFRVKCITHRRKPLWTAATFSSDGLNGHLGVHAGITTTQDEADALNYLRTAGFKVKDIGLLDAGREVVVIQSAVDGADKTPWYGKELAMALRSHTGTRMGPPVKYIIVVGPDIDPHDFKDVMWAMGTRTMPASDSIIIEKGVSQWGDPGGIAGALGWKNFGEQIMIDALIKVPERYAGFPPRSEPAEWEKDAIKRIGDKLR